MRTRIGGADLQTLAVRSTGTGGNWSAGSSGGLALPWKNAFLCDVLHIIARLTVDFARKSFRGTGADRTFVALFVIGSSLYLICTSPLLRSIPAELQHAGDAVAVAGGTTLDAVATITFLLVSSRTRRGGETVYNTVPAGGRRAIVVTGTSQAITVVRTLVAELGDVPDSISADSETAVGAAVAGGGLLGESLVGGTVVALFSGFEDAIAARGR